MMDVVQSVLEHNDWDDIHYYHDELDGFDGVIVLYP